MLKRGPAAGIAARNGATLFGAITGAGPSAVADGPHQRYLRLPRSVPLSALAPLPAMLRLFPKRSWPAVWCGWHGEWGLDRPSSPSIGCGRDPQGGTWQVSQRTTPARLSAPLFCWILSLHPCPYARPHLFLSPSLSFISISPDAPYDAVPSHLFAIAKSVTLLTTPAHDHHTHFTVR